MHEHCSIIYYIIIDTCNNNNNFKALKTFPHLFSILAHNRQLVINSKNKRNHVDRWT